MLNNDFLDEQRVESMIRDGLAICRNAINEYKPVGIIAAYSGGDDSVVSTHFSVSNFPDTVVFNADTLIGFQSSREHIRNTAAKLNWPLDIRKAKVEGKPSTCPADQWDNSGRTAYEEFVLNQGFPGRNRKMHSRMYQRLKERPLRTLIREIKAGRRGTKVLVVSGIRGDESDVRAGYKRAINVNGDQVWVNPFYWRSAVDFEAYRQEFGLPRNPIKPRCGISGECLCGTFSKNDERSVIISIEPKTHEYISSLEQRSKSNGFPWGWGESPPKWWRDSRRGQGFLFNDIFGNGEDDFQPMCHGCHLGKR